MRYRFIQARPNEVKYTTGVIHFQAILLGDFKWHLVAVKGTKPRREKDPIGPFVSLCHGNDLNALWEIEKTGFETTNAPAEKIMQRLVRDGFAELVSHRR